MSFHSLLFLFAYLPVTVGGYFAFNRISGRVAGKIWLVAASLIFYGSWNAIYVPLLIFSIAVNFLISQQLSVGRNVGRRRKYLLLSGIVFDILLLAYFKYVNFFTANIAGILNADLPVLNVVLPIGISFFTLQQIAFLMDSYENLDEEKSFLDYVLFVSFFPYLTAGPIIHRKDVLPLVAGGMPARIDYRNFAMGIFLFAIGLFKKVVCASTLANWVGDLYANSGFGLLDSWIASLAYTLQLYYDFSGYSDMALGLALLFNVTLPVNFNSPLKATNIVEFWRRWHISLANFMRTYVFAALLRSRAKVTFAFSLWVSFFTMLLMGVWHGAGWTYVLFGILHGCAVVLFSVWMKTKIHLPKILGWLMLFNFINLSLVPIRAGNLEETARVMKGMIGLNGYTTPLNLEPIFTANDDNITIKVMVILGLLSVALFAKNSMEIVKSFKPDAENLLFLCFLFVVSVLKINQVTEFIYFKF